MKKILLFLLLLPVGLLSPSNVQAKDNISIKFSGFAPGTPMFFLDKILPGDPLVSRTVTAKNESKNTSEVYVQGVKKGPTPGPSPLLENILDLTIKENGNVVYSQKLSKFFTDSSGFKGLKLGNIQKNQTVNYEFKVAFPSSAGNEYQGKSVIFDLKFFDNQGEVKGEHDDKDKHDKKDHHDNRDDDKHEDKGRDDKGHKFDLKKFTEACKSVINKFFKRG